MKLCKLVIVTIMIYLVPVIPPFMLWYLLNPYIENFVAQVTFISLASLTYIVTYILNFFIFNETYENIGDRLI